MFILRDLVSARTWLALCSTAAGFAAGCVAIVAVPVGLAFGVGTLPVFLAGVPVLGLLTRFCEYFARLERARLNAMLGARVPDWPQELRPGYVLAVIPRLSTAGSRVAWTELAYAALRFPLSLAGLIAGIGSWSLGLVLLTLPLYSGTMPRGGPLVFGHVFLGAPSMAVSAVAGALLLLAAAQISRGIAAADVAVASWLLGPRGDATARIAELERSRERVVDAAETERRRIERDLHDGAQQRLVALAMDLGRAKARFAEDPEAAQLLVDNAHDQAKAALTELRNLVRGVHPPVLTERGLDAAVSGVAALCPVPVTVHVSVPVRPRATVEAIAYFVIAEALTNIAKHSRASAAKVWIEGQGYPGTLTVMVSDDGIGGADPAGSGLTGLADRVAGVDGRLTVESPSGGPTIIAAVLPCA